MSRVNKQILKVLLVYAGLVLLCAACSGQADQHPVPSDSKSPPAAPSLAPNTISTSSTSPAPLPTATALPAAAPTLALRRTEPSHTAPPPTHAPRLPLVANFPNRPLCLPLESPVELAQAARVIDGDTIEVTIAGQSFKVRYIGIDTPEIRHPEKPIEALGLEAAAFNQSLVEGQELLLVKDVSQVDTYGRLLRYVFVGSLDGIFVNQALLRQGLAQSSTYPPDVACSETLRQAESQARSDLVGQWAPASASRSGEIGQVEINTIYYNGQLGKEEPDEYVEISNNTLQAIQLEGWSLQDKANHRFVFPTFEMSPGQVCRVYTNQDHPDWCGFNFRFTETAIWNNGGDCAYLKDAQGNPVDEYCYQF